MAFGPCITVIDVYAKMVLVLSNNILMWFVIGWHQGFQQIKSYDRKSLSTGMNNNIPMLRKNLVNKDFLI